MDTICKRRYTAQCEECDFRFQAANKKRVVEEAKGHINTVVGEWPDNYYPNQDHKVVFRQENVFYHTWDADREEGDDC